jgi:hypothetical protein
LLLELELLNDLPHFQLLAAHLVYGITLEGVRRLALKAL